MSWPAQCGCHQILCESEEGGTILSARPDASTIHRVKPLRPRQSAVSGQRAAAVLLLVAAAAGLWSKFYQGPADEWVNNSLGGVFYELFWCLLAFLCFPRTSPGRIAGMVLVVTCLLEFLQLWHPPFLEWLRSGFLGQAILGTSFAWSDFPYYLAGCAIGWYWMRRFRAVRPVSAA